MQTSGVVIGNYRYSNTNLIMGSAGFGLGVIYGVVGRKGVLGTLVLAIAFSMVGTGVGAVISKPTRIK